MASNNVSFTFTNHIPQITHELEQKLEQAMLKSAITVRNEVLKLLSGSRSGRLYRVPATRRTYRASSAFQPPASRLGHLRASYKYLVRGTGFSSVGVVGSDLPYSHFLEYGTYKMRPRPHLIPAFRNSKPKIEKIFAKAIK